MQTEWPMSGPSIPQVSVGPIIRAGLGRASSAPCPCLPGLCSRWACHLQAASPHGFCLPPACWHLFLLPTPPPPTARKTARPPCFAPTPFLRVPALISTCLNPSSSTEPPERPAGPAERRLPLQPSSPNPRCWVTLQESTYSCVSEAWHLGPSAGGLGVCPEPGAPTHPAAPRPAPRGSAQQSGLSCGRRGTSCC